LLKYLGRDFLTNLRIFVSFPYPENAVTKGVQDIRSPTTNRS